MGLRIRTNMSAVNGQRNLGRSTRGLQQSMEKLSSGYRINKAADDAAGLAVSDNLRADVRSLDQAKRNALDGVSLVQVAEGGLQETSNMLIRLRELSIQAASDTIGNVEREFLHKEFVELRDEIDRIAMTTDFNGTLLLGGDPEDGVIPDKLWESGNNSPLEVQIGKEWFVESDGVEVANQANAIRIRTEQLGATTKALGLSGDNVGTEDDRAAHDLGLRVERAQAPLDVGQARLVRHEVALVEQ